MPNRWPPIVWGLPGVATRMGRASALVPLWLPSDHGRSLAPVVARVRLMAEKYSACMTCLSEALGSRVGSLWSVANPDGSIPLAGFRAVAPTVPTWTGRTAHARLILHNLVVHGRLAD